MDRTLPLAALLEMSLQFPERAPSRLGMAQRGGSAQELARLATTRPDESAQEAAERILRLLSALSAHDKFTRGHAERVRAYTDLIAEKMGLPQDDRERLRWAALLHDIGKLRVPSTVLNKPAKPSPTEWDLLRQHPTLGSLIAGPLLPWLRPMDRVIAEHHERFDGTGYPVGLGGEAISPGARIVSVADCFEAMTAVRPYNKPMKREAALAEIVACAGTQFDPVVVRALLAVPQRRLLWAMGPTAWVAGLPMVGQGSLTAVRTAIGHASSAAVSATVVAVAAVAPSSLISSTPAPEQGPTQLTAARVTHPTTSARPTPQVQPTVGAAAPSPRATARPTPTRTTKAATHSAKPKPTPKPTRTVSRPPAATPSPAAPTTHPAPTTTRPQPTTKATRTTTQATTAPPSRPQPTTTKPAPTTTTTKPAPTTTQPAPTTTTVRPPATTAPATTAPATTSAPSARAACVATYASTSGRLDRLAATVTVQSTGGSSTTGWTVTWTWPGDQKIKAFTGALVAQSAKSVTAISALSDAIVAPGSSVSFTLSGDGKAAVPTPSLTCTAR